MLLGKYWNTEKRRAWFDGFAATKGFDPKVAENWHSLPPEEILAERVKNKHIIIEY